MLLPSLQYCKTCWLNARSKGSLQQTCIERIGCKNAHLKISRYFSLSFFFPSFFKGRGHYVAELDLRILSPQSPKCWSHRCVAPHPAGALVFEVLVPMRPQLQCNSSPEWKLIKNMNDYVGHLQGPENCLHHVHGRKQDWRRTFQPANNP